MCANKLDVQEAELISLDAGLRVDGIHALDLWVLVIGVFHSFSTKPNQQSHRS